MELDWDYVPLGDATESSVEPLSFDGLLNPPLKVAQDGGATGCGGKLWPAGDLLARYCLLNPEMLDGDIVELGAGTGLAGLAAARAAKPGSKVYITDQQVLLPLIEKNIEENELQGNSFAKVLNWGEPLPDWAAKPSLVLAADCVYLESAFPLLETTLVDLARAGPRILMAYKRRRKADKHFFKAIKKKFDVVEIKDFPNFEAWHRDSVFLFELVMRTN